MLGSYSLRSGGGDEAIDESRSFREHWAHLGPAIEALGVEELRSRQNDIGRLLEADGASYRANSSNQTQPWKLDVIPMLVSSAEWAAIETGIVQRAVLLDLVLRDVYGERKLLKRGVIPPQLVFEHPGFIRACDGIALADQSQLFTYAVDLGRDESGAYRVLADHAQAPSGSGYALENRVALSRVFPSLYRDAQVHHVAPYFRSLRAGLQAIAAHRSDDPRIVVLSPGIHSETAFEHAYLASYMGFSLVEGSDLLVQNGSVFLRAPGRLEPIDVILRRVDADYCDPLELRPESRLGVPGLLEAIRRGNVAVVNTIGSGAIENPALNAFLPAVAQALLGQDLQLPGVATWWCGSSTDLAFVLDHLDGLVCKMISGNRQVRSLFGPMLSTSERDDLRQQILAEPTNWVAQEPLALSTAPTLTVEGVRPRRAILRTFAVARDGSFAVMPGGLTRVAPDESSQRISNQAGAVAKDTWVLASEPELQSDFWLRSGPPRSDPDSVDTLSERAAENLFWVGRYAERAESVARLLRVVHDRRNSETASNPSGQLAVQVLLDTLSITTFTTPRTTNSTNPQRSDDELFALSVDASRPGSLAYSATRFLSAAEAVRDQLSIDTWQLTGTIEKQLHTMSLTPVGRQDVVQGTLSVILQSFLALQGLAHESMVRDAGWHFMEAGRRIERFQHVALLLKAAFQIERDSQTDSLVLESVLMAAESIITYRRRYRSKAQVETVLDLLVADPGNPRSMRYQAERLDEAVAGLPGNRHLSGPSPEERELLELFTVIRSTDTGALSRSGEDLARLELITYLDDLRERAGTVASEIAKRSFTQLPPQRSLTESEQV